MAEKTKILIFGESPVVLRAMEQYAKLVPAMKERYELLDVCNYNTPVPADVYGAAEIVMFSLYRRYGIRQRAEGIPALERRLGKGKKGLLYDFDHSGLADHPLVWVVPAAVPLSEKLHDLFLVDDLPQKLYELRQSFESQIFAIDGHRR